MAAVLVIGCGGGSKGITPGPPPVAATYTLTVASTNPASGILVTAAPADLDGKTVGTTGSGTGLSLRYNAGTHVTITAPKSSATTVFGLWSGCSGPSANVCAVTVNASTTLTVAYVAPLKGRPGHHYALHTHPAYRLRTAVHGQRNRHRHVRHVGDVDRCANCRL